MKGLSAPVPLRCPPSFHSTEIVLQHARFSRSDVLGAGRGRLVVSSSSQSLRIAGHTRGKLGMWVTIVGI
jgi:hypothetical protein